MRAGSMNRYTVFNPGGCCGLQCRACPGSVSDAGHYCQEDASVLALSKEAMLVIVHVSRLATIRITIITRGSTINYMFPVLDSEMLVFFSSLPDMSDWAFGIRRAITTCYSEKRGWADGLCLGKRNRSNSVEQ